MYQGYAEQILASPVASRYRGKVNLILTSPPFALQRQKAYGNVSGNAYIHWLAAFAPLFRSLLAPDGSIVMEMGNVWEKRRPVMSVVPVKALVAFAEAADLRVCQQFVWHNPARLPSPSQWVNVERSRLKDSFTNIWWFSGIDKPKATNRNVLRPYSPSMRSLITNKRYNHGIRPSEHRIGKKSFLKDNGGAIPPSVLEFSNTNSADEYQIFCRANKIPMHPARMPIALAEFFIKLLTDEGDLVLDPFAGSNTTGYAAERLGRRWIGVEANGQYIEGSKGRFQYIVSHSE